MIPDDIKKAIQDYVVTGQDHGMFIMACLSNDLMEALSRADDENLAALGDIMQFLIWQVPDACWGSRERVRAWQKYRGEQKAGQVEVAAWSTRAYLDTCEQFYKECKKLNRWGR